MSNPDTPQELDVQIARVIDKLVSSTYWTPEPVHENLASEEDRVVFVEKHKAAAHSAITALIEAEASRRAERLEREYSQRYDLGYAEGSQKGRERLIDELKVLLEGSLDRDGSADHEAITNGLRDLIITRRNEIREKK